MKTNKKIENAIVEKYKDKIYFQYETILGTENVLNLRTVKSIALAAGLIKPSVYRVGSIDNELTGDSYTDNCISINCEQHDFYGEPENEVRSIYKFCKWIMKTHK